MRRISAQFPGLCRFLLGSSLLMTATLSKADNLTVNDLTDTLSVSTDGSVTKINVQGDSSGEFLHFLYTSTENSIGTATHARVMLEPDTSQSDLFMISATLGSPVLDVKFYSDPAAFPTLGGGVVVDPSVVENGTAQLMASYFNGHVTPVDQFFAASDLTEVGDVPEPTSLILLLTVAVGLGVRMRRIVPHHS